MSTNPHPVDDLERWVAWEAEDTEYEGLPPMGRCDFCGRHFWDGFYNEDTDQYSCELQPYEEEA